MKRNSRLSSTLHILVHMAEVPDRALTSEELAGFIHTNPVVVRRTIAGLREAGIVTSGRGHAGDGASKLTWAPSPWASCTKRWASRPCLPSATATKRRSAWSSRR